MRGGSRFPATELRLSLAVYIAVLLASFGLHVLLGGAEWWFEIAVVSAVVLGAAAMTRVFARHRYLPTLVASLVLVAFITARFAADTAILGVLPGGGTIDRIVVLASQSAESIRNQSIPATADTSLLLLILTGTGVIAITVDLVATTLRRPALAGVPLLILVSVPAMTDFDLSDGFAFALAAAGYLWLLVAGKPRRRLGLSIATGAFAISAALVVPLVLPPVQAVGGSDSGLVSMGINPTINLGKDLQSSAPTTALTYSTDSHASEYLRLVTLDKFSGDDWAPAKPKQRRGNSMNAFPRPAGLNSHIATTAETTEITIGNLRSPWLPLPYPTSSVTGLWGNWYWEPDTLEVSSPTIGIENQSYRVKSLSIQPTPLQLSAAGSVVPRGFGKYLAVPERLPAIISDTANQVAGGEQGSYAKAIALQQYFRGDAFTYSVKAPVTRGYDGTGMAVIAKFLQVKSGYCVHFASAMAVMARSLGIPARIAVGFQPGTAIDTGVPDRSSFRVTSHDLHAWPELYFEDIGWVPFEPTPGRGEVPKYADLSVAGVPTPLSPAQLAAQSTASPAPTTALTGRGNKLSDVSVGAAHNGQELSALVWISIAIMMLLLLLLLPALRRALVRAARLRAGTAGLAWCEILTTADDLGHPVPQTLTPRQSVVLLTPVAGGEPLQRLCLAVERESFASGSAQAIDAADARAVIASLQAEATAGRQFVARFFPPSVWRRLLRVFRRGD